MMAIAVVPVAATTIVAMGEIPETTTTHPQHPPPMGHPRHPIVMMMILLLLHLKLSPTAMRKMDRILMRCHQQQ